VAKRAHLHVTVDPGVLEAARARRRATGVSMSYVVETALRRWVAEDLPETTGAIGEAMQKRHTILIVDDDPLFVKVMQTVLDAAGYEVVTAKGGKEALALMRDDKPDLAILDIMMDTALDGLYVSKSMREDDELRRIPVIMVSSIASTEYASLFPRDDELNAVDFLFKPLQPSDLLASIGRFLK
jgi:adenylate cyclase